MEFLHSPLGVSPVKQAGRVVRVSRTILCSVAQCSLFFSIQPVVVIRVISDLHINNKALWESGGRGEVQSVGVCG